MTIPLTTETETLLKPGEPNHCRFCGSPYMEIDRMAAEINRLKERERVLLDAHTGCGCEPTCAICREKGFT